MAKAFKTVVFLGIFAGLLYLCSVMLKPAEGEYVQIRDFYNQPKNSLDFVAIGSSHAYCTFDPIYLEKLTGKKSYTFSTAALSFPGRLCYLKEMYKRQNPKVVFMDMTGVDLEDATFEKHRHENFSYLPMTLNRYRYAFLSVQPKLWEEMAYPLRLYHSNWTKFNSYQVITFFKGNPVKHQGYVTLKDAHPITLAKDNLSANHSINVLKLSMLDQIVELAKSHNTTLVLFAAPSSMEDQAAYLSILEKRYSSKNNVHFLNMNDWLKQSRLDEKTDFFDSNHLNYAGVRKISPFIAQYLNALQ